MNVKNDCKYALLVPTSMGVRLTPVNAQPVHSSSMFEMFVTSAESNVASISSFLGLPVKVLTAFVKDSPISSMIKQNLRSRGMDFEGPEIDQDGPWGYRHQFNIAGSGFGSRGPRVWNDRSGEVARILDAGYFDLDRIFRDEGVGIVHLSGLIAALSPQTAGFCLQIARKAKEHGTCVSFDLNYRASFWKHNREQLSGIFHEIALLSDILIGNEEDYQLCLSIKGPDAGGHDISSRMDSFKEMIRNVRREYAQTSVFATTLRQVVDTNKHLWGALVLENENLYAVPPREITVLDRIGGGDGFVGGLLYAILKGMEPPRWIEFAWACGALATTFTTDYAQPADEDMVWSVWKGNARVKR